MRKFINEVTITGDLVKTSLEEKTITKDGKNTEVIAGDIILRTVDKSEFEIKLFSNKYKKDSNEESFFYTQYAQLLQDAISIENAMEGQTPSVVTVNAIVEPNDFKIKNTNNVVSTTVIKGKFVKVESQKDAAIIAKEATFRLSGIIGKIEDELNKDDTPTGNKTVVLYPIKQRTDDYNNENSYEPDEIYEFKGVIEKDLVVAFDSVGYYEGCFVELTGKFVNTTEVTTEVIQQAFGAPVEKKKKTVIKRNVIKSGSTPSTIYEVELTDEMVEALKQKRVHKLEEIKQGVNKQQNNNAFGKATAPTQQAPTSPNAGYNPFAPKN